MNTLMRNMVLMCFSAFVLNTAILAYADAGYFADNKQKIKEYISSDTLHYYIKDYQGNVRCVVRQDGAEVESNEYYPYGGLFSATASTQPYKYGAKELDRTHGLDLYGSEARWYDSLLGRTTTMNIIGYDEFDSEGGLSYFYTSGYGTTRPQYIALAHELAHIEDLWKGSFDTSTWYNSGNDEIYNAEKYALFVENRIRREHNQPLRLYYEHFTYNLNGINLYIPNRVSKIVLGLSDYNYLLKNYSR